MNEKKIKVIIRCWTYNHEKYIMDAIGGFVMQETTFPFAAIIIDDHSTDKEQELLWHFVNSELEPSLIQEEETDDYIKIIAPHKKNQNCTFVILFLKYNHSSIKKDKISYFIEWQNSAKYIASCEGDDYWTSPHKLQKQVDFLEEHDDYSCCCHRFKIYYENTDTWTDDFGGIIFAKNPNAQGIEVSNIQNFRTRFTWTLTLCFRKSVYDSIVWPPYKYGGKDFNFHYHLLKMGKGWCFADYMGVYRKHDGGVWSKLSPIDGAYHRLDCYEDLYKFHPTDKDIKECYLFWLDKFYNEFVIPPFRQHKLTRDSMKNLCYYLRHCWKAKCPFNTVFKNSAKCVIALLGIKRV